MDHKDVGLRTSKPRYRGCKMTNLDNLFNNIRYSQELFIRAVVPTLQTKVVNKVNVNEIAKRIGVKHDECSAALKALSIAEIVTYEGVARKHTTVVVVDEETHGRLRERIAEESKQN